MFKKKIIGITITALAIMAIYGVFKGVTMYKPQAVKEEVASNDVKENSTEQGKEEKGVEAPKENEVQNTNEVQNPSNIQNGDGVKTANVVQNGNEVQKDNKGQNSNAVKKENEVKSANNVDNKKSEVKSNNANANVTCGTSAPKREQVKNNTNTKEEPKTAPKQEVSNSSSLENVEQLIFQKVNEERKKAGVSPLKYNYTMQKFARDKSKDMGVNNYFSHEDLKGKLESDYIKAAGVSYSAWGENIAYLDGYSENVLANTFMTNWMNSPGHRANILSTNFTSIGVGVYKIGNKYYATQEFLR